MGLGGIFLSLWKKHLIPSMFSFIVFIVLSLYALSIEVISGGVTITIQEPALMYITWFFSFVAFIVTLIGAVSMFRSDKAMVM